MTAPVPMPVEQPGWLRPAPGVAAAGWRRAPEHRHPPGHQGQLDEIARRLSHEELAVARLLVGEGHSVRSLPTSDRPTGDLSVCGRETEVKSLRAGATSRTVSNALKRAREQGVDVIIDARWSGLLRLAAERGVADFAAGPSRGRVERVRVIGSGFDRSYQGHDLDRMGRHSGEPRFEPGAG